MAGVLLTLAMFGLMALALIAVARIWPHSSRRTGYRITGHDKASGEEPPVPEDDDATWHWKP